MSFDLQAEIARETAAPRITILRDKLANEIYGDVLDEVADWSLERLVEDLLWRWQDAVKRADALAYPERDCDADARAEAQER